MEPFVTDTTAAETSRVRPADLTEIVQSVFDTMLKLPFATECSSGCVSSGRHLEAHIHARGCWNVDILVRVPDDLARRIACAMFDLTAEELTDAEIHDALGEVVNVIGGSVKGVVDCDLDLSLPRVAVASDETRQCSLHGTFECCGQPVAVALIEQPLVQV